MRQFRGLLSPLSERLTRLALVTFTACLFFSQVGLGEDFPLQSWDSSRTGESGRRAKKKDPKAREFERKMQEAEITRLLAEVDVLLIEGNLEEAVETRKDAIDKMVVCQSPAGILVVQKTWLQELEKVVKGPAEQQAAFQKAFRAVGRAKLRENGADFEGAKEALLESIEGFQQVFGGPSLYQSCSTLRLANEQLNARESEVTLETAARVLSEFEALVGKENQLYADTLDAIGRAYNQLGRFNDSESYALDALILQRRLFGAVSLEYSNALSTLCEVLIKKENVLEAEAVASQAILILKEIEATNTVNMATLLYHMADISIAYKEYERAEKFLDRSFELYDRLLPSFTHLLSEVSEKQVWVADQIAQANSAQKKADPNEAASAEPAVVR